MRTLEAVLDTARVCVGARGGVCGALDGNLQRGVEPDGGARIGAEVVVTLLAAAVLPA